MTFFDKFFTIRNRNCNKTEDEHKLKFVPLSSPVFDFNKDQIRIVLFRECNKRGRKLLFDSKTVEKLPISSHIKSENSLDMEKSDRTQNAKLLEFTEVTSTHGYKYKKPYKDVTLLGEMIFGSVAMVFKSGSTCKIHKLSSPKRLMFTNIVHAPEQCHDQIPSSHYFGAGSDPSLCEYSDETRTTSSDSKLYKQKHPCQHNVNTYPCIKHKNLHVSQKACCCGPDCDKGSSSENSSSPQFFGKLDVNDESEENSLSEGKRVLEKENENSAGFSKYRELSLCFSDQTEKKYEFESPSGDNTGKGVDEDNKDILPSSSKLNNSLSSWKRRWMQSRVTSVEEINETEEADKLKPKTKKKLGVGLVVELSNDVDDELEKFLFNHSVIIDSVLKKLQSSIETACVKRGNFVDLTYTAFINCQRSVYELITGEKYARGMWLSMVGETKHQMEMHVRDETLGHENAEDDKTQDTPSNVKIKFLNDFCDLLARFDTKDTNFFISTLLTAVLTHHLSWVTEIGESDVLLPQNKLRSTLKTLRSYNPIWAQLNDLNGLLGSPLKCARTVVTGSESNKSSIASVIQVLTYFIRCYDVVETSYNFDVEDISNVDLKEKRKVQDFKNVECGVRSKCDSKSDYLHEVVRTELNLSVEKSKTSENSMQVRVSGSDIPITEHAQGFHLNPKNNFQTTRTSSGMKKSKSFLFPAEKDDDAASYPSVDHRGKGENVHLPGKNECDSGNEEYKKISRSVKVPGKAGPCYLERGFDNFGDCDSTAIHSIVAGESGGDREKQTESKDGVLFVLGEDEELVNLKRVAGEESRSKNLGNDHDSSLQLEKTSQLGSVDGISPSTNDSKNTRVLNDRKDVTERALSENCAILPDIIYEKVDDKEIVISGFHELPMPKYSEKRYIKRILDVCSVLGSVNHSYNSEQVIQGVLEDRAKWENTLRKDLNLYAHDNVLDRNVTEALCIIGDMNSWEVSLMSSSNFSMDKRGCSSIRIGMSQLVADMLESLFHICKINLPPDFCLNHIERKLHEIYAKSKCVAEMLNSAEVSSIEYLTSKLDISVNDVPLLLSVATTHSPHISSRYGLTYM